MRKSTFAVALGALAVLGMGTQASAVLLVADGFSYPAGNLVGAVGSGWAIHSGGGTPVQVSGGSAIIVTPGSDDVNLSTGAVIGATETWYYASKFTITSTTNVGNVNDDYHLMFKDGGTFNLVGRLSLRDHGAGDFQFGIQSGSSFTLSGASDGIARSFGTEYLAVVRWDNATGTATAWIDPVDELSPNFGGIGDASRIATAIETIAMRQDGGGGAGADNDIWAVNGFAAATTFGEAVTGSMVPEPASLALLGLGGLAMLRRKA